MFAGGKVLMVFCPIVGNALEAVIGVSFWTSRKERSYATRDALKPNEIATTIYDEMSMRALRPV